MTRDERILKDLGANLRDKILRSLTDYHDLCDCADLSRKAVSTEAMHLLMRLAAGYAASRYKVSPGDFASAMGDQFQDAQRMLEEEGK